MLGTIQNAGRLLSLFDENRPEWGVSEIAKALGINKSNAHNLLCSLAEIGLLRRTAGLRYGIGWRTLALSRAQKTCDDIWTRSEPVMSHIADLFGERTTIAKLAGDNVVFLGSLDGFRQERRGDVAVGFTRPAYLTVSGKVLLACRPWSEVETAIGRAGGPAAFTSDPTTTIEVIQRALDQIREQGYAYDYSIWGRGAVAAPIRDRAGNAVAALGLGAPLPAFDRRRHEFRAAVVDGAQTISDKMRALDQPVVKSVHNN